MIPSVLQVRLTTITLILAAHFLFPAISCSQNPTPGTDTYAVEVNMKANISGEMVDIQSTGQATAHRAGPFIGSITDTRELDVDAFSFDCTGSLGDFDVRLMTETGNGKILYPPNPSSFQVDSFFDITYRIDFIGGSSGPLHTASPLRIANTLPISGIPFSSVLPSVTQTTPSEGFTPFDSGDVSIPLLNESDQQVGVVQSVSLRFYPWVFCYPLSCNLGYTRLSPPGTSAMATLSGNSRIAHGCFFHEGAISQEIQQVQASGSGVELLESSSSISSGTIGSALNSFPAESFFDVFFEVSIDGIATFNKDPLRLRSFPGGVTSLPFQAVQHFGVNCPIDLYSVANPNDPPAFRIDELIFVPSNPIRWWIPYYSCYIVKLDPFCFPIPFIPFNLFTGFGASGSPIATGMTNADGILDFQNLPVGRYSVKEEVPPGYTSVTEPIQDVDLPAVQYAGDYYGTIDGKGFGGNAPSLPGTDELQLGMTFEMEVGAVTMTVNLQGPVTVKRESPTIPPTGASSFDTEILSMTLTGTMPGGGTVMVRESPTRPSHGRFMQTDPTGSFFSCDSFFDVFWEISLDRGNTWSPSQESAHISDGAVAAYPPINEMFLGPPTDVLIETPGTGTIRIRKWWWWWLPWYEYYIPYINIPPKNTPTPTATSSSTQTPTLTPTETATLTPTNSPTPRESSTPSNTATSTQSPTATSTSSSTPTPKVTSTPSNTPTFTRRPTNTPTVTPTATPSPTSSATWTPTPRVTPTPTSTQSADRKPLLYSIEHDTLYNSGASIALEGDVLIGGTLSTILGGKYDDLLVPFLKDPPAEGRDLGLDAIDAITVVNGTLRRAFFSVERPFIVTNSTHPMFGLMVSDGDLLTKSGLVIPNAMIQAPFDLLTATGVPIGDIGFDGVDVEGVTPSDYDAWTASYYASGGNPAPPSAILDVLKIFWSFEEIPMGPAGLGTTYTTGALAAAPVGPGVPISEDDVLETDLVAGSARVFRAGADGIPAGVPLILDGLFSPALKPHSVGLDALDMPNSPVESDEAGETGPVGALLDTVLFSTEIDDPVTPSRFIHGDLMADPPIGASYLEQTNAMITGHPEVGDAGLDGVDCLGDVYLVPVVRSNPCRRVFLPQDVHNVGILPGSFFDVQIRTLRGCEIQRSVRFQFQFSPLFFQFEGADAGPNFMALTSSKVSDATEPIVEMERAGNGEPGELIATLHFSTQSFSGNGTIGWLQFEADGGGDVAGEVPPIEVSTSDLPSKPVLNLPDPITSSSVQAKWFANPLIENVTAYTASVRDMTGVVAEMAVEASETSVLLSGLNPGTDYTLNLLATNGSGDSEPAELKFKTRFDPFAPDLNNMLLQLGLDWTPSGGGGGNDLQSSVPSPVDINLDGLVNSEDALRVLDIQSENP